jgi:hypothetical protein
MAELALTDVYGASATQSSTTVTFTKSELDGLVPSASNATDSITLAILNQWTDTYTAAARTANPDQSIVATMQPIPQIVGNFPPAPAPPTAFKVYTYSVQVFVPEPVTAPSPGDVG